MVTEGTWPHVVGGVSSWCQLLLSGIDELDFAVLPLVAGDEHRRRLFPIPHHVELLPAVELWTERLPLEPALLHRRAARPSLPAELVEGLLGWDSDLAALEEVLVWCRLHPRQVRPAFRSPHAWAQFITAFARVLDASHGPAGQPPPVDILEAARLYQTLHWVARTASVPTPAADVVHITAAGWSVIPAVTHRALQPTRILLTEHGIYVREAYLGAIQRGEGASARFTSTRLSRGLTRLSYAVADVVSPVTASHAGWEARLGVPGERIRPIVNGVDAPEATTPPPGTKTVVSVGRIDPLKDVATMLRVAEAVLRRVPDARFVHYGPVSPGQEAYGSACTALHERLGLGDRFRFMGSTSDPHGALRAADVVLMTSISEGLPMAVLEGMAQARPVVSTTVGGVADTLTGCGLMAPPCDVDGLALGVVTLLEDERLGARLGRRGFERLQRRYRKDQCVSSYRSLLTELAADSIALRGRVAS